MDGEVHAQPDEQHRESHGDEIEMADGKRREGGRPDQPHDERHQGRRHHSERAQPHDQQHADQNQRDQRGRLGPRGDAFELFRLESGRAGDPDLHAILRDQPEVALRLADPFHGRPGGVEPAVIEHRLGHDDAPAGLGHIGGRFHDLAPGHAARLVPAGLVHDRAHVIEKQLEIAGGLFAAPDFAGRLGHDRGKPPEAQVFRQAGDEGLGLGETGQQPVQIVDVQIKEAVLAEKRVPRGVEDGFEPPRPFFAHFCAHFPDQEARCRVGPVGRRPVDHEHDIVGELRKRLLVGDIGLAVIQVPREHVGRIGVDLEAASGDISGTGGHDQGREDHDQGVLLHTADPTGEK